MKINRSTIIHKCLRYNINNYSINLDGSIDVHGDVNLFQIKLEKLPLNFGKVSGNFSCAFNKLTTLEGSPVTVGGFFDCSYNTLTSLEGAPHTVGRFFDCSMNSLTNILGGPTLVRDEFKLSKLFDGTHVSIDDNYAYLYDLMLQNTDIFFRSQPMRDYFIKYVKARKRLDVIKSILDTD